MSDYGAKCIDCGEQVLIIVRCQKCSNGDEARAERASRAQVAIAELEREIAKEFAARALR